MRQYLTMTALAAGTLALSACEKGVPKAAETAAAALKQMGATAAAKVELAGGAVAAKLEPQDHLDSALTALGRNDAKTAGAQLTEAAKYLKAQAVAPAAVAVTQLNAAAKELDDMAKLLVAGKSISAASLDSAMARTALAEAAHHRLLASAAWRKHDAKVTADELSLALAQCERAYKDASVPMSASTQKVLDSVQTLVTSLGKPAAVPARTVDNQLEALSREMRALNTKLEKHRH